MDRQEATVTDTPIHHPPTESYTLLVDRTKDGVDRITSSSCDATELRG